MKALCEKELGAFGYLRGGQWVQNSESKWRTVCVEVTRISSSDIVYPLLTTPKRSHERF